MFDVAVMSWGDLLCMTYAVPALVLIMLRIFCAAVIYKDAKSKGIEPAIYTVLGILLGIIGLIIYYVFREDVHKKRARNSYYAQFYAHYGYPYGSGGYPQHGHWPPSHHHGYQAPSHHHGYQAPSHHHGYQAPSHQQHGDGHDAMYGPSFPPHDDPGMGGTGPGGAPLRCNHCGSEVREGVGGLHFCDDCGRQVNPR